MSTIEFRQLVPAKNETGIAYFGNPVEMAVIIPELGNTLQNTFERHERLRVITQKGKTKRVECYMRDDGNWYVREKTFQEIKGQCISHEEWMKMFIATDA